MGTLLMVNETMLARKMIDPQVTSAIVGRISNSLGHSGSKKSCPRWVALYTRRVSPDVPTIVMPARSPSTVSPKQIDSTMRVVRALF